MYDVTARRHAQHPDGEPVNAGKSASVAAKAAAIDAAQARPLTWKTVVMRALAVAAAGRAAGQHNLRGGKGRCFVGA